MTCNICTAQRGRGWAHMAGRLTLTLVVASLVLPSPSSTQGLPTCDINITHLTNLESTTASPSLLLLCSLPSLVPPTNTSHWQWNKLSDMSPLSSQLFNISSTSTNSTYQLGVQCGASGHYQASYLTPDGDCVYSCQFFVQIIEVDMQQILSAFSDFPNQTFLPPPSSPDTHTANLSYPALTSDILIGTCSSDHYLPSGCMLAVTSVWYRDGELFEPTLQLYSQSLSEAVTILSLTELTVGYYVCTTALPSGLGSYRTVDVAIAISTPVSSPSPSPPATLPASTETPHPSGGSGSLLLGLEAWEVGLIAANMAAVLTLFLCVCTMAVCVSRRCRHVPRDPELLPLKAAVADDEEDFVDFSADPAEIPFNAIVFQELLHKGTFKTVHHAIVNHAPRGMCGLDVAVKRLKDDNSELGTQELMAEFHVLKSIQDKAGAHPHFVSLVGVASSRGPPCLLLEYMCHGSLDRFLWSLKKGPVPEWYLRETRSVIQDQPYHRHVAYDLMRLTLQVADGMCFLANHGFVHHDLSTRNVFIGPHLQVKIGNTGMYHEGYYYMVSERDHFLQDMAPECLWEKRFSLFSDVWSFGILLYKVVTLETNPYPGVPHRDLYDHIVTHKQRPRLLSSFSNQLYFLLQRCWQAVPIQRPTFPVILSRLQQLNLNPTQHIILKSSKNELTPGYVSENGQVFLHSVAPHAYQPGHTTRRASNPISSADDTVYSRETTESVLYLNSSEVESTYTGQETEDDERGEEGVGQSLWVQEMTVEGEGRGGTEEGHGEQDIPLTNTGGDTEGCGQVVTLIEESNIDSVEGQGQGSRDHKLDDKDGSLVYF